jgi:hypothetical protein
MVEDLVMIHFERTLDSLQNGISDLRTLWIYRSILWHTREGQQPSSALSGCDEASSSSRRRIQITPIAQGIQETFSLSTSLSPSTREIEIFRLRSNVHEVSRDSTEKQRSVPSLKGEIGISAASQSALKVPSNDSDRE